MDILEKETLYKIGGFTIYLDAENALKIGNINSAEFLAVYPISGNTILIENQKN